MAAGAGAARAAEESEEDVLASVPGEILDTAIAHCRVGERPQALAMFRAIREQLDPPPALLRLVTDLEASGCSVSFTHAFRGPRVLAGFGYDSNVSQGIRAGTLTIGPPGDTIELLLDKSFRPRSSGFVHAAVDVPVALPAPGWNARLAAAVRRNERAKEFDIGSFGVSVARTLERSYGTLRLEGESSELWLGGNRYQRTTGLRAVGLAPASPWGSQSGLWLARAGVTHLGYHTQSGQDALHWEIAGGREQRLSPAVLAFGELALQYDRALGTRPGGDRRGFELATGLVARVGEWQLRPELRYQHWNSADVFAPGIIDQRRRNRLWQYSVVGERKLSAKQTLVLEWRSRISNDVIPLYQFRAHSLAVSIQHQF